MIALDIWIIFHTPLDNLEILNLINLANIKSSVAKIKSNTLIENDLLSGLLTLVEPVNVLLMILMLLAKNCSNKIQSNPSQFLTLPGFDSYD